MQLDKRQLPTTEIALVGGALIVFVGAAVMALEFRSVAKWFPLFATISGAVVSVGLLLGLLLRPTAVTARAHFDTKREEHLHSLSPMSSIGLLCLFGVVVALAGMWIATVVWLPAVYRGFAKASWAETAMALIGTLVMLVALTTLLKVDLPPSVLFR